MNKLYPDSLRLLNKYSVLSNNLTGVLITIWILPHISNEIKWLSIGLYISNWTYVDFKSLLLISILIIVNSSLSESSSFLLIISSHWPKFIEDIFGLLLFFCSSIDDIWIITFFVSIILFSVLLPISSLSKLYISPICSLVIFSLQSPSNISLFEHFGVSTSDSVLVWFGKHIFLILLKVKLYLHVTHISLLSTHKLHE